MQLANTAYSAQYKNDILRTLMNYMASYETINERVREACHTEKAAFKVVL